MIMYNTSKAEFGKLHSGVWEAILQKEENRLKRVKLHEFGVKKAHVG